ncbi:MAG: HEAT repeat domain-containing protein [Lentisphaerae bacterium]|nr:MAG: HEAT repeat domain-containing protein [Lentisphaerota bacterium]
MIGKNVTSLPAEVPALLQAKEERLVHCAAIILARCPEKRPELMANMMQAFRRARKSDTRQALIKSWSTFGHDAEAAMPILLEIIANPKKYPYGEVIGACRSAAGIAADSSQDFPQLVTLLTQRLRSAPHYSIKQVAAEALGRLGKKARPAIPALIVLLRKDVHYMQSWAAHALTRIDATDPRVKEVLSWYAKHGKWVKLRQRLKDYLAGKSNALVTQ